MRRDPAGGRIEVLDRQSCHAVLQQGYIELSSVGSRDASHHLSRHAAPEEAVQILAIGTDDIEGARTACERSGIGVSQAMWAAREIAYGQRHGEARFHWLTRDRGTGQGGLWGGAGPAGRSVSPPRRLVEAI